MIEFFLIWNTSADTVWEFFRIGREYIDIIHRHAIISFPAIARKKNIKRNHYCFLYKSYTILYNLTKITTLSADLSSPSHVTLAKSIHPSMFHFGAIESDKQKKNVRTLKIISVLSISYYKTVTEYELPVYKRILTNVV